MSSVYDRFWKIFLFIFFSFGKGRDILMVVNIRRRMKGVRSAVLKDRSSLCLCVLSEDFLNDSLRWVWYSGPHRWNCTHDEKCEAFRCRAIRLANNVSYGVSGKRSDSLTIGGYILWEG